MNSQKTYILAIESSCDDTSAAVLLNDSVLSNEIASQKIHEEYGGVVPELASRAHQQNIVPVVHQALKNAGITTSQLSAIAFTKGPGLMGSLLVGTSFAKSMALALNIPLISVHHLQAHLLAHFIKTPNSKKPKFPFIGLTISGGHTQITVVKDFFDMNIIGETLDDAVGEAYDKCGKMLNLPYPAGPLIDKLAQKGNPKAFDFPIPNVKNLDFSFSGLKTAMLYFIQRETTNNKNFITENIHDICASFQATIIQILQQKLKKTVKQTGIKHIAIGGGVAANSAIRAMLIDAEKRFGWTCYLPDKEYTTDNAAMIGIVGYYKFLKQEFSDASVAAMPRYTL